MSAPVPGPVRIRIQLTQYGPGKSVGGWDADEDVGTNEGFGSFGNRLVSGETMAITRAVAAFLAPLPEGVLQVEDEAGNVIATGNYGDRAEWNNPAYTDPKKWAANFRLARIDLYNEHFDLKLPDGLEAPLYASIPVRRAQAV